MGAPARGIGRGAHGQGAGAPAAPGRRAGQPAAAATAAAAVRFCGAPVQPVSTWPARTHPPPCLVRAQVEDLSRQVAASRQQPVTVVHTGGSTASAGTYVLYGAAGAVLGVVVYYRVFKGWTLGDMLYATRRGLKEGLAQVSAGGCCVPSKGGGGVDGLGRRVAWFRSSEPWQRAAGPAGAAGVA